LLPDPQSLRHTAIQIHRRPAYQVCADIHGDRHVIDERAAAYDHYHVAV
jgi:hypothetical protein